MSRNMEIKARVENIEAVTLKVAEIANEGPSEIAQDDTFFRRDSGRLKLRARTWLATQVARLGLWTSRPCQQAPRAFPSGENTRSPGQSRTIGAVS